VIQERNVSVMNIGVTSCGEGGGKTFGGENTCINFTE